MLDRTNVKIIEIELEQAFAKKVQTLRRTNHKFAKTKTHGQGEVPDRKFVKIIEVELEQAFAKKVPALRPTNHKLAKTKNMDRVGYLIENL